MADQLTNPITSAASAAEFANLQVIPLEDKADNLLRNRGSEIDLASLYGQQQGRMMQPGQGGGFQGQGQQGQALGMGIPQGGNSYINYPQQQQQGMMGQHQTALQMERPNVLNLGNYMQPVQGQNAMSPTMGQNLDHSVGMMSPSYQGMGQPGQLQGSGSNPFLAQSFQNSPTQNSGMLGQSMHLQSPMAAPANAGLMSPMGSSLPSPGLFHVGSTGSFNAASPQPDTSGFEAMMSKTSNSSGPIPVVNVTSAQGQMLHQGNGLNNNGAPYSNPSAAPTLGISFPKSTSTISVSEPGPMAAAMSDTSSRNSSSAAIQILRGNSDKVDQVIETTKEDVVDNGLEMNPIAIPETSEGPKSEDANTNNEEKEPEGIKSKF